MTIAYEVLADVVARLRSSPIPGGVSEDQVRMDHRTAMPKDVDRAIRVIPEVDHRIEGRCVTREMRFTVAAIARADDSQQTISGMVTSIAARLQPSREAPYPNRAVMKPVGDIRFEAEVSDTDVISAEIDYLFTYEAGEHTL